MTIKKTERGWEVLSEKKGRSMGIYNTQEQAEKRLEQIESFKTKFLKSKGGKK